MVVREMNQSLTKMVNMITQQLAHREAVATGVGCFSILPEMDR